MSDPVLDISTLIERPSIAIDGETYEIMSPEELPLMTSQKVAAMGRRLDNLLKADVLKPEQQKQLGKTLADIAAIVMEPVPVDVRHRLSDAQLMSVVEVFTMLSLARKARLAGAMTRRATSAMADPAKAVRDPAGATRDPSTGARP